MKVFACLDNHNEAFFHIMAWISDKYIFKEQHTGIEYTHQSSEVRYFCNYENLVNVHPVRPAIPSPLGKGKIRVLWMFSRKLIDLQSTRKLIVLSTN